MGRGAPQGRRPAGGARGYDRADRLNELLVRILAEEFERIDDAGPPRGGATAPS